MVAHRLRRWANIIQHWFNVSCLQYIIIPLRTCSVRYYVLHAHNYQLWNLVKFIACNLLTNFNHTFEQLNVCLGFHVFPDPATCLPSFLIPWRGAL